MASGRVSKPAAHLIKEMGETALTAAKQNYYFALGQLLEEQEYGCVGMAVGSGIDNTNELNVLGYEEVMATTDNWEASVGCEHELIVKNDVWEVVDSDKVPPGADIIDSMWVIKKKLNGEYWVRLTARGFKQTQGKSFIHHDILLHVMHDIMVRIELVLMLMGNMVVHLVNVSGEFLLSQFKLDKQIYMKIPCGFEKLYVQGGLLFLKWILYGVKDAAKAFWRLLLGIMIGWGTCGIRLTLACIISGMIITG